MATGHTLVIVHNYLEHFADAIAVDPGVIFIDSCDHLHYGEVCAIDGIRIDYCYHAHVAEGHDLNEDWTGSDGAIWDAKKWTYGASATTAHFQINGNEGRGDSSPLTNAQREMISKWSILTTDFDIQVELISITDANFSQWYHAVLKIHGGAGNVTLWRMYDSSDKWLCQMDGGNNVTVAATGHGGQTVRIKKVGSTVTYYKKEGAGSWELLDTKTWANSPPYTLRPNVQCWTINPNVVSDWDNLIVSWPKNGPILFLQTQQDLVIQPCDHFHDAGNLEVLYQHMEMNDAYHEHFADNVIIDPAWVYGNDCYHEVEDDFTDIINSFWIEFTDYTVDVQPTGWTERWSTSQQFPIKTTSTPSEKSMLIDSFVGTIEAYFSWDQFQAVDVEVLYQAYIITNQNGEPDFIVRGQTAAQTGYNFHGIMTTNEIQIIKWVNNVRTALDSPVAKTINQDTYYWVRFRVEGNALKAKMWAEGSAEPSSWDIEIEDEDIQAGGYVGPYCGDYNNAYWYMQHLSVATGGARANNILAIWDSNHDLVSDEIVFPLSINEAYHLIDDNDGNPIELDIPFAIDETYNEIIDDGPLGLFTIHGAYHPHVGDSIGIFNSNVVPNACDHLHYTDNIFWPDIQEIQEAYHLHDSDTLELTQTLTISECYHDIDDNDGVSIELKQTMGIEECYHEHFPDQILGMDIAIQVAQTYHAHASPEMGLTVFLDINETYHEHFPDTLYFLIPLVVSETYHEHDAETFALGAKVYGDNIYHIHTADSPVLYQVLITDLVVAESHHIFNTEWPNENIDLIVTPAVEDCYHEHFSDTFGLNVHLDINNVSHETFSDNIEIDQSFLNPADTFHTTDSSNIALAVSLVVAETYHEIIDDGPLDFSLIYVLATAECYHDIDSDNLDLVNVYVMSLAECYHTTDIEGPLGLGQLHRLGMDLPHGHSYHLHYADNIEFSALIKIYAPTIKSYRPRRAS